MVNFGQAAVGIIVLLVVTGGLLYLFYSRTNAVEKAGYGALAMLSLVSIMIPVFWIREAGFETDQMNTQQVTAVTNGMQLYAQYCVFQCYAIVNNKLTNVKYNGYPISTLNALSDFQLQRIISAGVWNPQATAPSNPNQIPMSQDYGGALDANQLNYMFQFIRSADPAYLKKQGFDTTVVKNGFDGLVDYLQNSNPTAYQAAVNLGKTGQFGSPTDDTKKKVLTLNITQPISGASCTPSCFNPLNVKVKVGTTITWINTTDQPHTVTAIVGNDPTASPKPAPTIFDSGNDPSKYLKTGGKFTYTIKASDYKVNPDHTIYYFCRIHPTMLAELIITQ